MNTVSWKKITQTEWTLFAAMILVAVVCRWTIDIPNFKPVAAFALMGGYLFRSRCLAMGGVLAALLLSDVGIGFYNWPVMIAVYFSLASAVLLGVWIRDRWGETAIDWKPAAGFAGASFAMSTWFFLLSNGAVWWTGNGYNPTLLGLAECYLAGVPFYRLTIAGDLLFTGTSVCLLVACQQFDGMRRNQVSRV